MRWLLMLVICLFAGPALAHALAEVQADLLQREPNVVFEPGIGKPFPAFKLTDADGQAVDLAGFRGKVLVLDFISIDCGAPCAAQSRLMAEAQADVAAAHLADLVRFVSISLEPEKDTAAARRSYGKAQGLAAANWLFLAPATRQAAQRLAQQAGLKLVQGPGVSDPPVTFAIDRNGWLRGRFTGLHFDPLDLVVYVNALTNDHHDEGGDVHRNDPDGN